VSRFQTYIIEKSDPLSQKAVYIFTFSPYSVNQRTFSHGETVILAAGSVKAITSGCVSE
jgi:hypothetical protein